jgi:hypothetical protein
VDSTAGIEAFILGSFFLLPAAQLYCILTLIVLSTIVHVYLFQSIFGKIHNLDLKRFKFFEFYSNHGFNTIKEFCKMLLLSLFLFNFL